MSEMPDWTDNPELLERVFLAAVGKGDTEGVDAALRLMACCDPRRAQRLYDDLAAALHIARGGNYDVRIVPA